MILGVSVDEVTSKKDFAEKYSLPFQVLSDAKTEVTKSYGALVDYPQFKIYNVARRDTFIIDPQGKIARTTSPNVASSSVASTVEVSCSTEG